MRRALVLFWAALLCVAHLSAADIAFSPQSTFRSVTMWLAAGCPAKPIPAVELAVVAANHHLVYLYPQVAADTMNQRSILANVAKWGAVTTGIVTGMMGVKFIQAKPAWVQGGTGVSTFLGIIIPLASKAVPAVRQDAGGDLAIGSNGCGTAWFYAATRPDQGPFVETLP